ncbi:MAG: hypothetical protein AB7W47_17995 [Calditrichaceae bacterium]
MKIDVRDRSNYYKGMLLLIGKDRAIDRTERESLLKIGETLGFNREFCEQTMDTLFENKYILQDPFEFSSKEMAEIFLKDGVRMAFIDKELHVTEFEWLFSVAEKNSISGDWLLEYLLEFLKSKDEPQNDQLEIERIAGYLISPRVMV